METDFALKSAGSVSLFRNIQNRGPVNNLTVSTERGVGNIAGLQRRILSHPNSTKVKEIPAFLSEGADFSVHCPPVWAGHRPTRVFKSGKRGETHSTGKGYPDPPVPRQLVAESPVSGNLPTTYSDPLGPLP